MSALMCEMYNITNSEIVASSLPSADYDLWITGSYSLGARVTHNNKNWEAMVDGATDEPGLTTEWLDLGLVNRLRAFDTQTATASEDSAQITYQFVIPDKMVNAIGFLRVEAQSIDITITDDVDGIVYEKTYAMVDVGSSDIFEYFFSDYQFFERTVDINLPPYFGCTIDITINPSLETGVARVGLISLTYQHEIGGLEWGYQVGIEDFSTVTRDPNFGITEIIEKDYNDTLSLPVVVDTSRLYEIKQMLTKLRAKPALYIGSVDHLETVVFGKYDKLGMVAGNTRFSNYKLDLQETI